MFGQVSAPPLRKIKRLEILPQKFSKFQKINLFYTKLTLLLQQLHCFHFVGVELVVEFVELEVEQLAVEQVVGLVVEELGSELEL